MISNINKKYCFKISLIYFASVLFANLMGMLFPMAMDFPTVEEGSMVKWIAFTDDHNVIITILTFLCFFVPSAICVKHCFSFLRAKSDEEIARKIINLPLKFSVVGSFGWVFNFLTELIFLLYAKIVLGIHIFYISFVFNYGRDFYLCNFLLCFGNCKSVGGFAKDFSSWRSYKSSWH